MTNLSKQERMCSVCIGTGGKHEPGCYLAPANPISNEQIARELTEALSHEGAKDFRIEALEAALDWALPAVFEHYTEGKSPKTPGAREEIEKGRARVLAELERLRATGLPVETESEPKL